MQLYWKSVMKMGKITTLALAASLSLSAAFAANAALLDFTDLDTFTAPDATADVTGASGMIGSIKWTLTPSVKPMTYNFAHSVGGVLGAANPGNPAPGGFDGVATPGGTGLAYDGDGVGIKNDEVSGGNPIETLVLSFSDRVQIKGLHFLDLFFSTPDMPDGNGDRHEAVNVFDTVTGMLLATFVSDQLLINAAGDNGGNAIGGYKFGDLDWIGKSLTFRVAGSRDDTSRDFALAGVNVSPIPLPAAGFLLLTAIGGLAAARRRKSA
jgi:hypothetical protein